MSKEESKRYWIVNNKYEDAVSAVVKVEKGRREGADVVELSDSEYHQLMSGENVKLMLEDKGRA